MMVAISIDPDTCCAQPCIWSCCNGDNFDINYHLDTFGLMSSILAGLPDVTFACENESQSWHKKPWSSTLSDSLLLQVGTQGRALYDVCATCRLQERGLTVFVEECVHEKEFPQYPNFNSENDGELIISQLSLWQHQSSKSVCQFSFHSSENYFPIEIPCSWDDIKHDAFQWCSCCNLGMVAKEIMQHFIDLGLQLNDIWCQAIEKSIWSKAPILI